MTTFISADKQWKVEPVTRDGAGCLRVLSRTPGPVTTQHDRRRQGTARMAGGWFLRMTTRDPSDIEQFTPLAELAEA